MFMQVIHGRVRDEQAFRESLEQWGRELQPGADGYLGTTAGITDDGTVVVLARFESAEAAARNSERPEQGEWWARAEATLDGPADFRDTSDVTVWLDGGSDDAGFVQVMTGQSSDVHRLRDLGNESLDRLKQARPEIIGGTFAAFDDGGYVQTAYFTSEAAARGSEGSEPPEDLKPMIEERMALMGDVLFLDLHQPILRSPSQ